MKRDIFVFVLIVFLFSCERNNDPTIFGGINGISIFSGCTIPISGVTISVAGKSATTGSDGKFVLAEVPVGTYTLEAMKTDYDPFSIKVIVTESNTASITIKMSSQRFTSNVYGVIKNQDGKAVSRAIAVILNPDNSESELRTTTSATGYYQLPGVPQGERSIAVNKDGYPRFQSRINIDVRDYQFDIILDSMTYNFTDSRDGHNYKMVLIGSQTWMAENLAYLPSASPSSSGSATSPYYYVYGYEGNSASAAKATTNYTTYGVLYNLAAAKIACPSGWHLPADDEWKILEMNQGMSESDAITSGWRNSGAVGGKLKEPGTAHWSHPNTGATNTSGFTALPGGVRLNSGGFNDLGGYSIFWSSSKDGAYPWYRNLCYNYDGANRDCGDGSYGFSVRCLQNN